MQRPERLGQWLFRFRELIGVGAGILTWLLAVPSLASLLIGLAPIAAGLGLRFWAAGHIGQVGRASEVGAPALVISGPYGYVRHPLYVANFLLVLGALFVLGPPWWYQLLVLGLFVTEYLLIARVEEQRLAALWGEAYAQYRSDVPVLIPRFRPISAGESREFSRARARGEVSTVLLVAAVYLLALLRMALLNR